MGLLEEIQRDAADSTTDLAAILRKCKILAAQLDSSPLEEWLIHESNGYPSGSSVPSYRSFQIICKGHFVGPFESQLTNYTIPSECLPRDIREFCEAAPIRMSVEAIQSLVWQKKDSEGGGLVTRLGSLNLRLHEKVIQGFNCLDAWGEVEVTQLQEVLNAVRNRVLDLSISLWKETRKSQVGAEQLSSAVGSERVYQIINNTIHGTAIIAGNIDNSQIKVQQGDFKSLSSLLVQLGLQPNDVATLERAIAEDGQANGLGPKVTQWMQTVLNKVGYNVSAGVLIQALCKYFGISG